MTFPSLAAKVLDRERICSFWFCKYFYIPMLLHLGRTVCSSELKVGRTEPSLEAGVPGIPGEVCQPSPPTALSHSQSNWLCLFCCVLWISQGLWEKCLQRIGLRIVVILGGIHYLLSTYSVPSTAIAVFRTRKAMALLYSMQIRPLGEQ